MTKTYHSPGAEVDECTLNPCPAGEQCVDPDRRTRLDYQCTNATGRCPAGFSHQIHDQCFKIVNLAGVQPDKTWNGARDYCRSLTPGGDLASIHDEQEARLAFALYQKSGKHATWLGIHDNLIEGRFMNLDGTSVNELNVGRWRWSRPLVDDSRNCVFMDPDSLVGSWFDTSCTATRQYALCGVRMTLEPWAASGAAGGDGAVVAAVQYDPDLQLYDCGAGQIDCPDTTLAVDVSSSVPPANGGLAPTSFVLTDANGMHATVAVPAHAAAKYAASLQANYVHQLHLNLGAEHVMYDPSFNWAAVQSLTAAVPSPLSDESAAAAGMLTIANARIGRPLRVGYKVQDGFESHDSVACRADAGWFELSPFTHHYPARYQHCRECCCSFDDPVDPDRRACYDQGSVVADVSPGSDLAPNDQCAVCNRDVHSDVMTNRNYLLPVGADPPYATCDDTEECTYNDRCTDEGACIGTLYLTCLNNDVLGMPDPARNCEMCDGTGPNSTTRGCVAKPGHFV